MAEDQNKKLVETGELWEMIHMIINEMKPDPKISMLDKLGNIARASYINGYTMGLWTVRDGIKDTLDRLREA